MYFLSFVSDLIISIVRKLSISLFVFCACYGFFDLSYIHPYISSFTNRSLAHLVVFHITLLFFLSFFPSLNLYLVLLQPLLKK